MTKNKNIYIPQISAKDIWLTNYSGKNTNGYSLYSKNKELNKKKFKATFDYSLDLIQLNKICENIALRESFETKNKIYSNKIINVTFDYNVKAFNKLSNTLFVRSGYDIKDIVFNDGVCVIDDIVVAIRTEHQMPKLQTNDVVFEKSFKYNPETMYYSPKSSIKIICGVDNIRADLYDKGFMCDGVKYVRWKRSVGSARVGKCLFIQEDLKQKMFDWERCGLDVKDGDTIDLAAFESYISLTSSSIIDTIHIPPESILVIDDIKSTFKSDVISVFDENGRLCVKTGIDTITNTISDGESLIERTAIDEKYRDKGMLLLRKRMFKSCCFNSNIQQWFADNNITEISQLNGFTLAKDIKDIKLITTPSSIKYLKFGKLEEWLGLISGDFGIVKYEKPTHFMGGRLVQTHYQLINSLQLTRLEIKKLLAPTFEFMSLVKKEPAVLKYWINYKNDNALKKPALSKSDIVYNLMSISDKFTKTRLYFDFRNDFLRSFFKNIKSGKILVEGNYSTICGNPIEMLKFAIGTFDGTSIIDAGTVHTTRFSDGEDILGSRSPHISFSNVLVSQNKIYPEITKYMNPTPEIVYINSINENILEQLAGSDFDSDSMLITNNKYLIQAAKRNYNKFKIAVNKTQGAKIQRTYSSKDICDLDIKTSKNLIGEIINLSQELNTLIWELMYRGYTTDSYEITEIYNDVCKLSIMSNAEIDRAKKEFEFDNGVELMDLRKKYEKRDDTGRLVKPNFFSHIAKQKGYYQPTKKNYKKQNTSMDYLQTVTNSFLRSKKEKVFKVNYIEFSDMINLDDFREDDVDYDLIYDILKTIDSTNNQINFLFKSKSNNSSDEWYSEYLNIKQECINKINNMWYTDSTIIKLMQEIEKDENKKYKRLIFYTLFSCANNSFYRIINKSKEKTEELEQKNDGKFSIFEVCFDKK